MQSELQQYQQKATKLAKDVETLKAALDAVAGIVEPVKPAVAPLGTSTPIGDGQSQLPEYSGPFSVQLPKTSAAPIISPTWLTSPVSCNPYIVFVLNFLVCSLIVLWRKRML